jgi:Domain of unknown function (DUF4340)
MKKEYVILILVIAGLVTYLSFRSTNQTHYQLPRLAQLESAKIDRMLVKTADGSIELVKKDAHWFLEPQGYPADGTKVQNMVNAATGLKISTLVSESGSYQHYDLNDDAKINVQIFEGAKKQREFDLGRVAPTYQHTFTKLADDPNIYYAQGTLKNTFDQSVADLRDKTVLSFDKDAVSTITLKKGERTLVATKKEITPKAAQENDQKTKGTESKKTPEPPKTQWQDAQGQVVDQTAVEGLLSTTARLQCEAYMDDAAKKNLKDPVWTLTLKTDSDSYTLSIFAAAEKDTHQVPALSSTSQYGFQLSKSQVDGMDTHIDTLLGIKKEKKQ